LERARAVTSRTIRWCTFAMSLLADGLTTCPGAGSDVTVPCRHHFDEVGLDDLVAPSPAI